MLSGFDGTAQTLKFMIKIVLQDWGQASTQPVNLKPFDVFVRHLAYLYQQETGDQATAYDHYQSALPAFCRGLCSPDRSTPLSRHSAVQGRTTRASFIVTPHPKAPRSPGIHAGDG